MRVVGAGLAIALLTVACADAEVTGTTTSTAAPTTTTTATTTTAADPTTTMPETDTTETPLPGFGFGSLTPGRHATRIFGISLTAELGEGWFGVRPETTEKVSMARTDSVARNLDVPYLEFMLVRQDATIEEVVAEIEGQQNIEVLSVEEVSIAGMGGTRVTARMEVARMIAVISRQFEQHGPANEPAMMRFDILDVDGTTLIVFAEALPEEFESFANDFVDPLLATLDFG